MNVLVLYAHPSADSFVGRLRDTAVTSLSQAGHVVNLLDLWAEGFDPLPKPGSNVDAILARHAALLNDAHGLLFVYPTWWGGQPAILKGWLELVLPEAGRRLRRIRRVAVVTTHGSPRWVNILQGEPGRLVTMRGVAARVHPFARRRWIALYGLDQDNAAVRERFAAHVAARMSRF